MRLSARRRLALQRKRRFIDRQSRGIAIAMRQEFALLFRGILRDMDAIRKAESVPQVDRVLLGNRLRIKIKPKLEAVFDSALTDAAVKSRPIAVAVKDRLTEDYIRRQEVKLWDLADRESRRIHERLSEYVNGGLTGTDLRDAVAELGASVERRAGYFAQNMAAQAHGTGRFDYWNSVGAGELKWKRWLPSIGGQYDRVHHNEIPGNGLVEFQDYFEIDSPTVGLVKALYPNDPGMALEESINCACDYEIVFDKSTVDADLESELDGIVTAG